MGLVRDEVIQGKRRERQPTEARLEQGIDFGSAMSRSAEFPEQRARERRIVEFIPRKLMQIIIMERVIDATRRDIVMASMDAPGVRNRCRSRRGGAVSLWLRANRARFGQGVAPRRYR